MGKWWFRLAIVAVFSLVLFILGLSLIPGDRETVKYANDGTCTVPNVIFMMISTLLMYFATDVLIDVKWKIGKAFRKIVMIVSFGIFCLMLLIGLITYIIGVNNGGAIQPFYDGLGLAPYLTYAFLYFFVVGRFEKVGDKEPNRIKQFILLLCRLVLPIAIGPILMLILNAVNNSTVTLIVLIAILLVLAVGFIVSIKKYGFFLGGQKEFDRDDRVEDGSSYSSTSGEWETKFVQNIEGHLGYGQYVTVRAYASLCKENIEVNVTIEYYGASRDLNGNDLNPKATQQILDEAAGQVRGYYKKVAKDCPYSPELNIEYKH
ncbi:MAG: hypothetical protein ACI32C_02625 [Candidatus Enteromonas sp.]